VIYKMR